MKEVTRGDERLENGRRVVSQYDGCVWIVVEMPWRRSTRHTYKMTLLHRVRAG
jgi:hypothetical protein